MAPAGGASKLPTRLCGRFGAHFGMQRALEERTISEMSRGGVIGLFILLVALNARGRDVDYARDVLPILSNNCYKCHGPEETDRQKDLRLDRQESALRVEDGIAVIVPGNPAKSELVRRISSNDPDEVMPPSDDAVR